MYLKKCLHECLWPNFAAIENVEEALQRWLYLVKVHIFLIRSRRSDVDGSEPEVCGFRNQVIDSGQGIHGYK